MTLDQLEQLRQKLPEYAKDIKLNLQGVLSDSALSEDQRWGVAVASAIAAGNVQLRDVVIADARINTTDAVLSDAAAAAVVMGMNNVYYRFRHMMNTEAYNSRPPRLRMNRINQVATNKADFELYSLAVSAINACEMCIKAHEQAVVKGGLTEDHVHDAVRIAAVIHAAAAALSTGIE